jgi:hypothetical protein
LHCIWSLFNWNALEETDWASLPTVNSCHRGNVACAQDPENKEKQRIGAVSAKYACFGSIFQELSHRSPHLISLLSSCMYRMFS